MPKGIRMTQEYFLKSLKEKFGDKYDFSMSVFKGQSEDVTYVCPIHGVQHSKAKNLLSGYGCYQCGRESQKSRMSDTKESFIEKAKKLYGDFYDYSKVEYKNNNTKVEIVCPVHGSFFTLPRTLTSGHGCPKCANKYMDEEYFIEKSKSIHGDRYDYSKVHYTKSNKKVCIICKRCGKEFWITPNSHISSKTGCECYAKEAISKAGRAELIYGVAVNDDDRFVVDENGVYYPSYTAWIHMLKRCYDEKYHEKHPTYKGCSVDERWLHYGTFRRWFEDPENGYMPGYELEKDIRVHYNKVYSPETCLIVPRFINTLFTKADKMRGDTMIGVTKTEQGNYSARLAKGNKQVYLGRFPTEMDAFLAYKREKESFIKEVANDYYHKGLICKKVYDAMYAYEVMEDD